MLHAEFEKRLDSFTLNVRLHTEGSPAALFGSSGAGKSMTLKCIAGIEKPDRGVIRLNDRVLFDSEQHICLPPQKRRVGYLFQDYALFPNMTVLENVKAGLRRLPRCERDIAAQKALQEFRIEHLSQKRPDEISGGEKQRAALARIFVSAPEVLLLDEPFSSLDETLKLELLPYINELIRSFDGETVLVSHRADEVIRLCDQVAPISEGVTQEPLAINEFYNSIKEKYKEAGLILPAYEA